MKGFPHTVRMVSSISRVHSKAWDENSKLWKKVEAKQFTPVESKKYQECLDIANKTLAGHVTLQTFSPLPHFESD